MKPVFKEETISLLKRIIDASMGARAEEYDIDKLIDQIENALKELKDNQENKALLYGTSIAIIVLSITLTFTIKTSWPLMFFAIWFGMFMYYRVHEKGLILNNLDKLGKVDYHQPLTKISFIKSAIDLKLGRKAVLKTFLSVLISSGVMMAHFLFVDTSFWMNIGLLSGAIVASYFFWEYFFKEDIQTLTEMKKDLTQLESKIILGDVRFEEEE